MDLGARTWGRLGRTPAGVLAHLVPQAAAAVHKTCHQYRTLVTLTLLGAVLSLALASAAWMRMPDETPLRFFAVDGAAWSSSEAWFLRVVLRSVLPVLVLALVEWRWSAIPRSWARGPSLRRWAAPELWPVLLLHLRTFVATFIWLTVPITLAHVLACIGYHRGMPMPALVPVMISTAVFLGVVASVALGRVVAAPPTPRARNNPWVGSSTP